MSFKFLCELFDRSSLPYRKTTDVFIFDGKGNIVAKDAGHYIQFPGGGVDDGENIISSGKREVKEEVGAIIKNVKIEETVKFIWPLEWADSDKRKKRYKIFKGEEIFLLTADIVKISRPTSEEGDDWDPSSLWMPVKKALAMVKKTKSFEELEHYRQAQIKLLTKYSR